MTAKDELELVRTLDKSVDRKLQDVEAIQTMIKRVTGCLSGVIVQGGQRSDFTGSLDRLREVQQAANAEIDSFIDYKTRVTTKIDSVDDPLLSELLYDRYILYKDMRAIAIHLDYNENYVYRLHDKAVEAYAECGEEKITKVNKTAL